MISKVDIKTTSEKVWITAKADIFQLALILYHRLQGFARGFIEKARQKNGAKLLKSYK
jgi:hypothetical protein